MVAAIRVEGVAPQIGEAERHGVLGAGNACRRCFAEDIGLARHHTKPAEGRGAVMPVEGEVLMEADGVA